jgi:hypothetical protein
MKTIYRRRIRLFAGSASAALVAAFATPSGAAEGSAPQIVAQAGNPAGATDDRQLLLQRLQQLEQRLNQLEGRPAGAPTAGNLDTQAILDRLDALDARLGSLETNAVLSEPKTIVRQVERYVDQNGNEYDEPGPNRREVTTYQRERVFRRQSIGEEIEGALAAQEASGVTIGVSSVTTVQGALQANGAKSPANGHVYGLSQADVTFLAKSAALNTSFFADLVGIGGSPPDQEIPALNLLNNQAARLSNNQLNLREAWIRTELFNQRLALSVGQLDLTNYFDRNVVANDETTQFINGSLANNAVLGLTRNGLGIAAIYDSKSDFIFKLGVQQSNPAQATSLSSSLYTLGEAEYIAVPFGLPEGHYRLWFRLDNSTGQNRTGFGVSIDQKVTPAITLFGRYGNGYVGLGTIGNGLLNPFGRVHFYSGGVGFQAPLTFTPLDRWGIGFAQTEMVAGPSEKVVEGFYNFHLTDHLALSALLQYVSESTIHSAFFIPGLRMGVAF